MAVSIRRMTRDDLQTAFNWAAREGWNPGLNDAEPFFAADTQGFFLAEHDGMPVGTISAVAYDERFGFIGLYLVDPEYRGGRIGVKLGEAAREYLGTRCVGLDGVVAKQAQYARYGYRYAYGNVRYEGVASGAVPINDSTIRLVHPNDVPFDELTAYDAELFPARRAEFLAAWLRQPGTHARVALHEGKLHGYAVLRPCRAGYKFGPLMANDEHTAELLFDTLTSHVMGQAVYLDVPEPNAAAVALAQRHGMVPVFQTARMYSGEAPSIDLSRIFGITTMELG